MGYAGGAADERWLQSAGVVAGDRALLVGPVPTEISDILHRHGLVVGSLGWAGAWTVQLPERATLAVVPSGLEPHAERAALHAAVLHLQPGGCLVVIGPANECPDVPGLHCAVRVDGWSLWRRTERRTVHDLVATARSSVRRVTPHELHDMLAGANRPTVIDTRSTVDRDRYGTIAGALHVPRTVLEFHLDPANGYPHPMAPAFGDPVVVVCNGGYSSSLAAANLVAIGFQQAGDLVGGMAAWIGAGLPVAHPDHCHLELPLALGGCVQSVPTSEV